MNPRPTLTRALTLSAALAVATGALAAPAQAAPAPVPHQALVAADRPVKATARNLDLPAPAKAGPDAAPSVRAGEPVQVLRTTVTRTAVVGVTWPTRANDRAVRVALRSHGTSGWSAWQTLEVEPTPTGAPNAKRRSGTDGITVTRASEVEVSVSTADGTRVAGAQLTVVDPGASAADLNDRPDTSGRTSDEAAASTRSSIVGMSDAVLDPEHVTPAVAVDAPAAVTPTAVTESLPGGMPYVNTRKAWGADESITSWPAWRMNKVKAIVVHHTAGANDYTADQVPGILRGIHYFHAVTRGWGDIGYNVLVDKYGRAWQGRVGGPFSPNLGGHAAPNNEETMGVSMLGNYETVQPPAAAVAAVARVAAYRLSVSGVRADQNVWIRDHDGLYHSYPAVVTHQAVAAYGSFPTGCPGRYMIGQMGTLRYQVQQLQNANRGGWQFSGIDRLMGPSNRTRSFELSSSTFMPWEDVAWSDSTDVIDGTDALVIASTSDYYPIEAIMGANLARSWDAPVIAVDQAGVTTAQLAEVTRLKPRRIFVVANGWYVPDAAVAEISAAANANWPTPVSRVIGGDGADTAAAIAGAMRWPSRTVYVADTTDIPYLAGLPQLAAKTRSPIVLTTRGQLSAASRARLTAINPTVIKVVGPTRIISDPALWAIKASYPAAAIYRYNYLDDANGITSMYVANALGGAKDPHYYYVSWYNLGLAGPALAAAGASGGAVFFGYPTCLSAPQWGWAAKFTPSVKHSVSNFNLSGDNPLTRAC